MITPKDTKRLGREEEEDIQKLFQIYIEECHYSKRLSPVTMRGYAAVFQLFLKMMPEVSSLDFLTTEMLNEFFKRIENRMRPVGTQLKSGVKNSTIKTQYSKLNVFFVWLCDKGYLAKNPLRDITPPRVNYDDFKRLKDDEVNKIYSAIVQYSMNSLMLRRDTVITSLLLFTGLRKGELIGLRVNDIDLVKNEITIRGETSKSKVTRMLALHPTLAMHLKDYLKERRMLALKTEQLIVSVKNDSGLTHHGFKHWVKGIIKKSGIKIHLHQFRHTFACKLVEANVNIVNIQKMMGHTDIKMTMKYLRSIRTQDLASEIGKISF